MSAAEQVGSLPELVELIVEFLEFDRAALYSAHLVNTIWAHYARKVLWRNAPFVSLMGVHPCRQQYYANMIQTSCTWLSWWHADLDKLSFPSLKRFLFDLWFVFGSPDYRPLLPPFFKTFPQYLDLWVKRCSIEKRIESCHEYESQGFEAQLVGRPRADRTARRKMVEIMSRLDFRENCQDLFLWDHCFFESLISFLLSANPQRPVFPNVKHFGAYIVDDPGGHLSALLPSTLSSLYLGLGEIDGPGPWFDSITHFEALQSFTLVTGAVFLDSRTSSLLGRLHSLRSLVISEVDCPKQYDEDEINEAWFTDHDIEAMTSGLPLLQHLELGMPEKLSLPSLTSLATNCPELKCFYLSMSISISAWGMQGAPLFPRLERIIITQGGYVQTRSGMEHETNQSSPATQLQPAIRIMDETAVDLAHVDIILRHCPRLEKLHLYVKDYGKEKIEQIRERMAQGGCLKTVSSNEN